MNMFYCFHLKMPLSAGVIPPLTSLHNVELQAFSKVAGFQETQLKRAAVRARGPLLKAELARAC